MTVNKIAIAADCFTQSMEFPKIIGSDPPVGETVVESIAMNAARTKFYVGIESTDPSIATLDGAVNNKVIAGYTIASVWQWERVINNASPD